MGTRLIKIIILSVMMNTSLLAADFSAPLIDLPRAKAPESTDTPLSIEAIVDDDVAITSVTLFYRIIGQSNEYLSVALEANSSTSKRYSTALPVEINIYSGIEYYVEARDTANNVTQEPFPNKPVKLQFKQKTSKNKSRQNRSRFIKGLYGDATLSYGSFTVDDPDGEAGSSGAPVLSTGIGFAPNPYWRGMASINYQEFSLPYSQNEIGQEVASFRLDLSVQRALPFFKNASWIGLGIGIEKNQITDRGTAVNGVFSNKFEDRDDTSLGLVVDFGYEITPVGSGMLGVKGKYYTSLDNGVNGILVGVFFSFN